MSTHQRTRQSQLCVSSDSDSDDVPLRELVKNTPSKTGNVSDGTTGSYSRSQPLVTSTPKVFDNLKTAETSRSERLRRKRGNVFHMPSRREVFNKIIETPNKCYSHLQPRSLINNYMKERNRYNYDRASTSGESSIDEFIADSDDSDSDSDCQHSRRQMCFTQLKQTQLNSIQSSSSEEQEEETEDYKLERGNTQAERDKVGNCWTNKRRNSALENESTSGRNSETGEATLIKKKRFRGSVLLVTSSDEEESQRGEVVDSGIDSTKLENSKTNTTADLANMMFGSTGHDTAHASVTSSDMSHQRDVCHSGDSDMESDASSVCKLARQNSHSHNRNNISTDDSDNQLDASHSSLGKGNEKPVMLGNNRSSDGEEGRGKTSERVHTLVERKQHRQSVIMAYKQQRMRRIK